MNHSLLFQWGLVVSLLFSFTYGQSPTTEFTHLDSGFAWIDKHLHVDSIKGEIHTKALNLLNQAIAIGEQSQIAQAHSLLSQWHDYYNQYIRDSILFHENKALAIYLSLGDKEKEAGSYMIISNTYTNLSQFDSSRIYLFKALYIYESNQDKNGIANAYSSLSSLYQILEDYPEAINYGEKAMEMLEDSKDYYSITTNLMEMVTNYSAVEEYQKSIQAAEECIRIYNKQQMTEIGIISRAYAFRGDTYKKMERYDEALKDYETAYKLILDEAGADAAQSWKLDIGNVLTLKGEYAKALPYLEDAIEIFEEFEYPQLWIPYGYMSTCYRNLGYFEKALIYSEKARDQKDSMYMAKVENLESEMIIKYETGKKDESIAQKDQQLAQEKQIRLLGFGLAALFALLLTGLFYNYRKNQKITKQLTGLNLDLTQSNSEKELLLKEVHHRVKNNLQVISSLLSLQSRSIQDESVKHAILDSQSRVRSMSLIHQKLYRGTNLAAVEMKTYFETLSDNLIDAYADEFEDIEVELEMNNIELDVDYAIPLGLITNELITNSLKYAFPDQKKGKINISLIKEAEHLILDIKDDGVGNGAVVENNEDGGFGSQLVEMLTQQLKGDVSQQDSSGFHTQIRFPYTLKAA